MGELYYDRENKKFYVREIITEKNGDILIATDEKYVDVTDEIITLRSQPKQERKIKKGDKVSIHCRKDREEYIIDIYDGKVGEVTDIWDKKYPWGHIAVKLDNGCNNSFHEDELEVLDESHWKPNEEQMEALRKLMKYAVSLSSYYDIQKEIESLYNDLNKLK